MTTNIHPIFDRVVSREAKEQMLGQRGIVLWFTGLSGAGKSTLAVALQHELHRRGKLTTVLDGDNLRHGLCANLGFSEADRVENVRRVAEVAKLFADSGVVTLCTFISPTIASRAQARQIIGEADFKEIFVNASLEVCEARDVKGLYKKARAGEIPGFTGIHQPYEIPQSPDMEIRTDLQSLEDCVKQMMDWIEGF